MNENGKSETNGHRQGEAQVRVKGLGVVVTVTANDHRSKLPLKEVVHNAVRIDRLVLGQRLYCRRLVGNLRLLQESLTQNDSHNSSHLLIESYLRRSFWSYFCWPFY